MINAVYEIFKCVSEIYFVIGVVSLFFLCYFKKELFFYFLLVLAVLLLERALFSSNSSRYYALYIIVFFFLFIFLLKKSIINSWALRGILLFSLLTGIFYNSIKCFHSSRNSHIFDMRESVERKISQNDHTTVLIDKNEFKRLCIATQDESKQKELARLPSTAEELDTVFTQYPFWEDDAFLYTSSKAPRKKSILFRLKDHEFSLEKTENYITNRKKVYSVYSMDKFHPPVFSYSELRQDPFLNDVLENGTMKSCNPEYDAYIFQLKNQLIWFLGTPIKEWTEVIYHLRTNRPDLLPPKRVVHKFDNLAIRRGDPSEIGLFGQYRVFAKDIPTEYPITKINVGLNTAGTIVWFKSFQVSDF